MAIYSLEQRTPSVPETAFVAPNASLIGAVTLGRNASVWFGAVLRGDVEPIDIGEGTNIQDGVVIHTDPGFPARIGDQVTVGHQAMLHGCTIGDHSLIGIQAVVLTGAVVGKHCLIGAGALVTERKDFPDRSLILGSPARVVRTLSDAEVSNLAAAGNDYLQRRETYQCSLKCLDSVSGS